MDNTVGLKRDAVFEADGAARVIKVQTGEGDVVAAGGGAIELLGSNMARKGHDFSYFLAVAEVDPD